MYQTSGQILLVLLARTSTQTTHGLEKIFGSKDQWNNDLALLVLSIIWSIKTLFTLHLTSVSLEKLYFPLKSKISLFAWTLFCMSKRILVLVMFFTPSLGLFDLLYHWKAEQIPFSVSQKSRWREGLLDQSSDLHLHNKTPVLWSHIDRWNYSGEFDGGVRPGPPDYSLYTGLSLGHYFFLFLAVLALHTLCVAIIKLILVKDFRRASLLEKFSHALQNVSMPQPWRSWDSDGGSVREHRLRFEAEIVEIIFITALNFVTNAGMLAPVFFLGKKNQPDTTYIIYHVLNSQ